MPSFETEVPSSEFEIDGVGSDCKPVRNEPAEVFGQTERTVGDDVAGGCED